MMHSETAESLLIERLEFLLAFGFSARTVGVQDSKLLGKTTVLTYASPAKNRQIRISYFRGSLKYPRSLTVVIEAGKRNFLLSDFLKSKGKDDLNRAFVSSDIHADEGMFLNGAVTALHDICNTDLGPIILGKAWEDIPFDWKGMK